MTFLVFEYKGQFINYLSNSVATVHAELIQIWE